MRETEYIVFNEATSEIYAIVDTLKEARRAVKRYKNAQYTESDD